MKVIGIAENGANRSYVAIVTHTELEKLTDKYYGKVLELRIGQEMDLGAGYAFREDIRGALNSMTEAMKSFERARATLMAFAAMVSNLPPELQPEANDTKGATP